MKEIDLNKIVSIVNQNIGTKTLTKQDFHTNLTQIGLDSICFVRIIVSLEEEFECEIPDSKLLIEEFNTLAKIVAILSQLKAQK